MSEPRKPNTESADIDFFDLGYDDAERGECNPPPGYGPGTPQYDEYERGRSAYLEEEEESE